MEGTEWHRSPTGERIDSRPSAGNIDHRHDRLSQRRLERNGAYFQVTLAKVPYSEPSGFARIS